MSGARELRRRAFEARIGRWLIIVTYSRWPS